MDLRLWKVAGVVRSSLQRRQLATLSRPLQLHALAAWRSVLLVDLLAGATLAGKDAVITRNCRRGRLGTF